MTSLDRSALSPLGSKQLVDELPGIHAAFDESAMQEALQAALFEDDTVRIERCEVDQATYVPRDCCIMRYELTVSGGSDSSRVIVMGRLYPDSAAAGKYMHERLTPLTGLAETRGDLALFTSAAAKLESPAMVAYAFPIDPELPKLLAATDVPAMTSVLHRLIHAPDGRRLGDESCIVEVVDYGRQHRCTLRYTLPASEVTTGADHPLVVYGKLTSDGDALRSARALTELRAWQAAGGAQRPFFVPEPLGWDEDLLLLLLEAIPGKALIGGELKTRLAGKTSDSPRSLEEMIEVCAAMAATLHASGISLGNPRTLDDELERIDRQIVEVGRISPELGASLQGWSLQVRDHARGWSDLPLCFAHGDFTPGQIMFAEGSSGLVDFDSFCRAEPALDLGQFLSYLRIATEKSTSDEGRALMEGLASRFIDSYVAAAGETNFSRDRLVARVSAYRIVSLLRRVVRSWQKFKPARVERAMSLIEEEFEELR